MTTITSIHLDCNHLHLHSQPAPSGIIIPPPVSLIPSLTASLTTPVPHRLPHRPPPCLTVHERGAGCGLGEPVALHQAAADAGADQIVRDLGERRPARHHGPHSAAEQARDAAEHQSEAVQGRSGEHTGEREDSCTGCGLVEERASVSCKTGDFTKAQVKMAVRLFKRKLHQSH